jgi:hypothetical protein
MRPVAGLLKERIADVRTGSVPLWDRRLMRFQFPIGDSAAIWRTPLTSGDTILTWTATEVVAVD